MNDLLPSARRATCAALLCLAGASMVAPSLHAAPARSADYIVAVVNQELVTAAELQQRIDRIREDARRNNTPLPPAEEVRKQVLDQLIDERVQVTNARDTGQRVDDAELDRAVSNVALQNQITLPQLRDRLRQEGIDYTRFRNNVRDQLMTERVREREVQARIKVSEAEIDALLQKRRDEVGTRGEMNIAQILVSVPEGASQAVVDERRARAEAAAARVKAGEPFDAVAREVSEDANKAQGGAIGLKPADRLPDVFLNVVASLQPGQVAPTLLRTGAGFHLLKLVERREANPFSIQQTHARHILLRVSAQLTQEAAAKRLEEFKRQILAGSKTFEQLARDNSEDGSAPQGGDLGWVSPGAFVPEFEETMNALPAGGLSDPLLSRFGVHLIQVIERRTVTLDAKQQREQARNVLREQKFEDAYNEWIRDLRARAYIEMREPPQP